MQTNLLKMMSNCKDSLSVMVSENFTINYFIVKDEF